MGNRAHGLGLRPSLIAPRRRLNMLEDRPTAFTVDRVLDLPYQYREYYDQKSEGACVGFGFSWMMSILNRRKYDAFWLYREAQRVDPWPETPPEEGTSEVAAADILMRKGHRRVFRLSTWLPSLQDGIESVSFVENSQTVDQCRATIGKGTPVGFAIPWFQAFDEPKWTATRGWVIGEDLDNLGPILGWHFICCFGARDRYDAFYLVNTWGYDYPIVKLPYDTVEKKLAPEGSTFALIVDRV